jgi:polysaccharide export outer membrane protein
MVAGLLFSCVSNKKVPYFKDVPDTTATPYTVKECEYAEPLIQPDDILSITIQTIDPQNAVVLNQVSIANSSTVSATGSQVTTGFLVDKEGYVEIPIIGKTKLVGLSTFKARDVIREKVSVYFKDPSVLVRYANYKITILGEVARPGTYTVPNEKVSLLDAIGLAGDLTVFGKRFNVLLIRENGNKKEFVRFDLNSTDIFKSPYYYLKQNDIIYIEPTKAKVAALNTARAQLLALVGTTLTVIIILASRVQY